MPGDIAVRRVYLHGKSLTFTLPGRWNVPDYLNVYTNGIYLVYSELKGLEAYYNAKMIATVKKRIAKSRKSKYYLITIPRPAANALGIGIGTYLFIIRTEEFGSPTFIVYAREDPIISVAKAMVIAKK